MPTRAEAKRQTREALAAAARQLVAERGFRETTVEDIAELAGVAPRTFFRHFPSKEAALFAREGEMAELLARVLAARPEEEPPLVSVRHAMREVSTAIHADGKWLVELFRMASEVPAVQEHLDLRVGQRLREQVIAWAERRLGAPPVTDPRPRVLGGVAAACADAALQRWLAHSGALHLPTLIEESFEALTGMAVE